MCPRQRASFTVSLRRIFVVGCYRAGRHRRHPPCLCSRHAISGTLACSDVLVHSDFRGRAGSSASGSRALDEGLRSAGAGSTPRSSTQGTATAPIGADTGAAAGPTDRAGAGSAVAASPHGTGRAASGGAMGLYRAIWLALDALRAPLHVRHARRGARVHLCLLPDFRMALGSRPLGARVRGIALLGSSRPWPLRLVHAALVPSRGSRVSVPRSWLAPTAARSRRTAGPSAVEAARRGAQFSRPHEVLVGDRKWLTFPS